MSLTLFTILALTLFMDQAELIYQTVKFQSIITAPELFVVDQFLNMIVVFTDLMMEELLYLTNN